MAFGTPQLRGEDGREHAQGPSDPSRGGGAAPAEAWSARTWLRPQAGSPRRNYPAGRALAGSGVDDGRARRHRLHSPALTPSPVRHRARLRPRAPSTHPPQAPATWQSRERASGPAPCARARRFRLRSGPRGRAVGAEVTCLADGAVSVFHARVLTYTCHSRQRLHRVPNGPYPGERGSAKSGREPTPPAAMRLSRRFVAKSRPQLMLEGRGGDRCPQRASSAGDAGVKRSEKTVKRVRGGVEVAGTCGR